MSDATLDRARFAIQVDAASGISFSCADTMYQVNHLIRVLALAALAVALMIIVVFQI